MLYNYAWNYLAGNKQMPLSRVKVKLSINDTLLDGIYIYIYIYVCVCVCVCMCVCLCLNVSVCGSKQDLVLK